MRINETIFPEIIITASWVVRGGSTPKKTWRSYLIGGTWWVGDQFMFLPRLARFCTGRSSLDSACTATVSIS